MERRGLDFVALNQGNAQLTGLYRSQIGDWPKFFKMDTLSKAGFVASELLLKKVGEHRLEGEEYTHSRAIVLFGSTASLCADRNYQETIQDRDNYYPSPALFVYTLPNIVTGEIAIRHHLHGETSFYCLASRNEQLMTRIQQAALSDSATTSMITGWIDYEDEAHFCADMYILETT
jgi:3-oxoacyl-[acyl-carrier-protein] synthase-1